MTCKVNADTTNGLKLTSDTSGEIDLQTNGTTKVHMDSSGNVGIGTTNPDGALTIQATGASDITYKYTDGNTKAFSKFDNSDFTFKEGTVGNDSYAFFTNNTEHERITPVGKHLFGSTSVEGTASDNMQISSDGGNIYMYQHTTALQGVIDFRNPNGYIGSIRTTGSSVQFNTSSDYRLKENVNYTFDATAELKRLKPCKFNFIADADTTLEGFLAHEVADVIPHAVSGEKDGTKQQNIYDEDSNITGTETVPDYQQIDQSKLVPLLVKTCQEQQTIIEDLQTRITALENN